MSKVFKSTKSDNSAKSSRLVWPRFLKKSPPATLADPPFQGLLVLSEGINPIVDIVAVHGLNGHRERTWTAENGVNWLEDLLPSDIENARILAWGYDANTHSRSQVSFQFLYNHAENLVAELCLERESTQTTKRPIIFVAHSIGGIVVKSALTHSNNARENALASHRSIKLSTYGIIFMGTPHQGVSGVALGQLIVNIASIFVAAGSRLLQHLERDSEWLQMQLSQYGPISGDFVTIFAYEEYPTPTAMGHSMIIVPRASAVVPGATDSQPIVIHADHRNMVRFTSQEDADYRTISRYLRLMIAKASNVVKLRWQKEDDVNNVLLKTNATSKYIIPFTQNRTFVGRTDLLATLRQKFFVKREWQRMTLVGLGGVGKTQVALEFAYSVKTKWPECSIFWVPAMTVESYTQACEEIVRQLGVIKSEENEDPKISIQRHLSSGQNRNWLLIIDNADSMDVLYGQPSGAVGVSKYFPTHDDGLILFTTRHKEAAIALTGSQRLEVKAMDRQEALELFQNSLTLGNDGGNDEAVRLELIEELALHPLAMSQAIAYLNVTEISINEYLKLMKGTEQDLIGLMSREFRDSNRYEGANNAVATTWLVTFDQIRNSNPQAAELLCFMSYLEHRAIPLALLPQPLTKEQTAYAMGILLSYAFITRRGDNEMYDMHRLVHLATRVWVQKDGSSDEVVQRLVEHVVEAMPTDDHENRSIWREYLPHTVQLVQKNEAEHLEETYEVCYWMGRYFQKDGRRNDSVRWLERVCEWRQHNLASNHTNTLGAQHALAMAYRSDGQVPEAVELLERIVAIECALAEDHPDRLASQHALAMAYRSNGQVAEAVELLKHVVAVRSALAEDHPSRLASQHELAAAYHSNGQVAEAVELLEHVVAVQSVLAEDHPSRLASQHELAGAYDADGQITKAIALIDHVVAVQAISLAKEHPDRLISELVQRNIHRKVRE